LFNYEFEINGQRFQNDLVRRFVIPKCDSIFIKCWRKPKYLEKYNDPDLDEVLVFDKVIVLNEIQ